MEIEKKESVTYVDTGVSKMAIGMPTDEEQKRLISQGYTFMSEGQYAYEPYEKFQIWLL